MNAFFTQGFGGYNTLNGGDYPSPSAWTQYNFYATTDTTGTNSYMAQWWVYGGTGVIGNVSVPSVKQVLTPASTGVTMASTSGGSTYNWASIDSGFNPNDASGYTY